MTDKVTKPESEWQKELSPEQYQVTRKGGTEPAFTGKYNKTKDPGTYTCVCCGQPLHHQQSAILSFLFVMGGIMFHLVLVFFYFSLFKYIFLIIGSPLFAYLSEQTEALINGKEYNFNFDRQLVADMTRGIRVALRNSLWQTVYTVSILILSFIPLIGWITPVISTFVECYYYGFSMLDYSCMRHKLSSPASIAYISQHKGLAIGNGMVFYGMHFVPILGWVLAPAYAVIAATISLYHQNLE